MSDPIPGTPEWAIREEHGLLTAATLSQVLCISRRTLRRWVRQGTFPPPRYIGANGNIPRWHPDEVIAHLTETDGRNRRNSGDESDDAELPNDEARPAPDLWTSGIVRDVIVMPATPLPAGAKVEIRVAGASS